MAEIKKQIVVKRRSRSSSIDAVNNPDNAKKKQDSHYIQIVTNNARYLEIMHFLKEGLTPARIADWLQAGDNLGSVTTRTMTDALLNFKKCNQAIINNFQERAVSTTTESVEDCVLSDSPKLDPRVEVEKLLRLQKKRIMIDFKNEKEIGKLFETNGKEMRLAMDLAVSLSKIDDNTTDDSGMLSERSANYSSDVRDELKKLKVEGKSLGELSTLTNQLASNIYGSSKKKTTVNS